MGERDNKPEEQGMSLVLLYTCARLVALILKTKILFSQKDIKSKKLPVAFFFFLPDTSLFVLASSRDFEEK